MWLQWRCAEFADPAGDWSSDSRNTLYFTSRDSPFERLLVCNQCNFRTAICLKRNVCNERTRDGDYAAVSPAIYYRGRIGAVADIEHAAHVGGTSGRKFCEAENDGRKVAFDPSNAPFLSSSVTPPAKQDYSELWRLAVATQQRLALFGLSFVSVPNTGTRAPPFWALATAFQFASTE